MKIGIENFKSIDRLELELGRVNLFIGENGCGKSSLLEAVAMLAAGATGMLSNAALRDRGIRVTEPRWMRSGFEARTSAAPIELRVVGEAYVEANLALSHDDSPFGEWTPSYATSLQALEAWTSQLLHVTNNHEHAQIVGRLPPPATRMTELGLDKFLVYAPREDVLRDLARDSDVAPIGIHGEGLFRLLQVLDAEGQLDEIKAQLSALGWFDDLSVVSATNPSTRALQVRDIYLEGEQPFDQRSTNEGFLFVLLYASLLISKYTPRFFAVDNVDTALNPKLCARVVQMFATLTKTHDRRVMLTAHNPGALDGINLHDDEQRLFVVYRNVEGRTRVRRILPADVDGEPPQRLSEAFLRGYLGALPTNF